MLKEKLNETYAFTRDYIGKSMALIATSKTILHFYYFDFHELLQTTS